MSANGLSREEFEQQVLELNARRQKEGNAEPRRYDSGPLHSYQSDRSRLGNTIAEHASAWMAKHQPRQKQFDSNDILDSLPDAFMLRSGLPISKAVHPMTHWAAELSLSRLAEQLHCRSLSASEFGNAIAHGFSQIITTVYDSNDAAAPCVLDIIVPDFRPADFPKADMVDLEAVAPTQEAGNVRLQLLNLAGAETGAVNTYRARIHISRQLLLADKFNLISALMQQLSCQAGRLPQQLIGQIISNNSNLADGQPLLGSSNTAASGVNLTGLGSAVSWLRLGQSDTDNVMNLTPAVLLVRPENEIAWRSVLRTIELTGQPNIRLVVNPWLPSTYGYSYLLASPTESAVFVRMVFQKPLRPTITSGQLPIEYDGVYLDFSLDFGIKAVSRHGIVRIPSS